MLDGHSTHPRAHSRVNITALVILAIILGLFGFASIMPTSAADGRYITSSEQGTAFTPGQTGMFFGSLVPAVPSTSAPLSSAMLKADANADGGVELLLVALVGLLLLGIAAKSRSK